MFKTIVLLWDLCKVYDRTPMTDPLDLPATKRDLLDFVTKNDLATAINDAKDDMTNRFTIIAENLADDFRAASNDQVAVLKDTLLSHDRRLVRLEDKVGV
jgi:hypothetical protein